jgi:zinc protease
MDQTGAAAKRVVDAVLHDGMSEDEIGLAKRRLVAAAIYSRDSLASGPRIYGSTLATGGTLADVDAWPARIAAVTRDQVMDAARAVLDDSRSVTSLLLPEGAG